MKKKQIGFLDEPSFVKRRFVVHPGGSTEPLGGGVAPPDTANQGFAVHVKLCFTLSGSRSPPCN